MKRVILDVDTGTDDAVAIMLAALHPDIELVACTTVNGNASVDYCTDNTLRVLEWIGTPQIPVYKGNARPLARFDFPKPRDPNAPKPLHGLTLPLPPARQREQALPASRYLAEAFARPDDDLTLIAVGPLTNLAVALSIDPRFSRNVRKLIIMGGGHDVANTTPSAEFNFWADPEAAAVVLAAGFEDVTLVPLDATHKALISYEHCDALKAMGTPAALAAETFIRRRIDVHEECEKMPIAGTAPVHDALCVASLIDPGIIAARPVHVAVETQGPLTVGRSVMDLYQRGTAPPNCSVAFDADAARFVALMLATFASRP